MTTLTATRTDDMRAVLAFALDACDGEGIEPYNVEAASRGNVLRIYLDTHDDAGIEEGQRLFAALGGHRHIVNRHGKTWAIYSSEWNEWAKKDFGAANVAFAGRLIEVQVACGMTEDADAPTA